MPTLIMKYVGGAGAYVIGIAAVFYLLDMIRAAVTTYILVPRLLRDVNQMMDDEQSDADDPRWGQLLRQAQKYDKWVGEKDCFEEIVLASRYLRGAGKHKLAVFTRKRA